LQFYRLHAFLQQNTVFMIPESWRNYINYFAIFRSGESDIQIFPLPLPMLMKVSSISLARVFTHLYSTSGGFASAQHLNLSSEPSTMRSIFERDTFGA